MTVIVANSSLAVWDADFTLEDYRLKGNDHVAVSRQYNALTEYFNPLSSDYDLNYKHDLSAEKSREDKVTFLAARLEIGLAAHMACCLYTLCKQKFGCEPEGFNLGQRNKMLSARAFNRQVGVGPRPKSDWGQPPQSRQRATCVFEEDQKRALADAHIREAAIDKLRREGRLREPEKMQRYLLGLQDHTPIKVFG